MLPNEYFAFFRKIEKNNNKEWFDAHKAEYEASVKAPFTTLVGALIDAIRVYEPELAMAPKDGMQRIYRDIRFSKNKTPYKVQLGAAISVRGRKDMAYPSFYFEAGVHGIGIYGGSYMPDKEQLANIRDLITHEHKAWRKVIAAKSFVQHYGEIRGERNKVLPAEFRDFAQTEPMLYNKQFYWHAMLPESAGTDASCVGTIMEYYKAGHPVAEFLRQAF